jgi:hypothetical protein
VTTAAPMGWTLIPTVPLLEAIFDTEKLLAGGDIDPVICKKPDLVWNALQATRDSVAGAAFATVPLCRARIRQTTRSLPSSLH